MVGVNGQASISLSDFSSFTWTLMGKACGSVGIAQLIAARAMIAVIHRYSESMARTSDRIHRKQRTSCSC
jgi:hypothetical protein